MAIKTSFHVQLLIKDTFVPLPCLLVETATVPAAVPQQQHTTVLEMGLANGWSSAGAEELHQACGNVR